MWLHRAGSPALVLATLLTGCQDSAPLQVPGTLGAPARSAVAETGHFHFTANGAAAAASYFTSDGIGGYTQLQVSVNRGGTPGEPATSIYYLYYACDPTSCSVNEGGYGLIPNEDFRGNGGHFSLRTNTSTNPALTMIAGLGGEIAIDWQSDGVMSGAIAGTEHLTQTGTCDPYGCSSTLTRRGQGRSTWGSASVTGTMLGTPTPPGMTGIISTNHLVSIEIIR